MAEGFTKYRETQYLRFYRGRPEKRKTDVVLIYDLRSGLLGRVQWFARWRQFAFFPAPGTVWNPECLHQVTETINQMTAARREERKR